MTDKPADIDARFDKIDEQLDRIANAVVKGFDSINITLETKAETSDVRRTLEVLDALAKQIEISEDERLVMAHQLTQLHQWVEKAAARIDVKFAH